MESADWSRRLRPRFHRQHRKCKRLVKKLHFNCLPNEVVVMIFDWLTLAQRWRVRAVCRRWRSLAHLSLRSVRSLNLCRYFSGGPRDAAPPHGGGPLLNDALFRQLLARMPHVRRLLLGPAANMLTRNGLLSIGKLCPFLLDLDISHMRLTYRSLEHLCRNSPLLQRIRLPQIFFSERSLEVIVRCLRELRSLKLSSPDVVGSCFGDLPSSLRTISLRGCSSIEAANLQRIGDNCHQLTDLSLCQTNVDSTALRGIVLGCRSLQSLDIRWCSAVRLEDVAEHLSELRRLLAGYCRQFTYTTAYSLTTHCLKLHTISLKVNGGSPQRCVPSAAIQQLTRLPLLKQLDISGQYDVTKEVLESLGNCSRLEVLIIKRCSSLSLPDFETALINMVTRCRSLAALDVSSIGAINDRTYSRLCEAVSPQRHLVLRARNTTLASLFSSVTPVDHVTVSLAPVAIEWRGGEREFDETDSDDDSVATIEQNEEFYDSDLEEERFNGRLFDAFADWLFVRNAFWNI